VLLGIFREAHAEARAEQVAIGPALDAGRLRR
jgi:hypothetical protein